MFYLARNVVPMQVQNFVLRVILLFVAGLGFCTPSWTDQRQLGLFSGLRAWAVGFEDSAAVEVARRFCFFYRPFSLSPAGLRKV